MLSRPQTLVEKTADWLRREIPAGRWGGRIPGIPTLARECGIAEGTARRAIRLLEKDGVLSYAGPGRRRQLAVTDGALALPRQMRVMVLLRDSLAVEDEGFRWSLAAIQAELEARGHRFVLLAKSQADLKYDDARVMKFVENIEADLWVVVAGSRLLLEWFVARPVPVFALGGGAVGIPGLAVYGGDAGLARAEIIRRLCELGHRRIVYFLPHFVRAGAAKHIQRELAEFGITAGPFNLPDWDETPGDLQERLARMFRISPPTVIFATSPVWLAGILSFLAEKGLRVPQDVSLVCGNHADFLDWHRPAIVHFKHDDVRLMRRVVQWVDNRAHGRDDVRASVVPIKIVEGESIGPPPAGRPAKGQE